MKKEIMKKEIMVLAFSLLLALAGCGNNANEETVLQKEPIPAVETTQVVESAETTAAEGNQPSDTSITQEQTMEAIRNYCIANNPELENMLGAEDYTVYFNVSTNEAGEIVVLYRSYTAAQIRYYVDPASGEVYVTELVPGIIDEEQRTDETFNIRDYMSK